jgi:chemotaxis protein methyltransferase CheR
MVRFAWLNLGGADALMPPSADLDLIMCRNVTIYFDDVATQRLYRVLVDALAPGGWLMLGPSDPIPADRVGLERVDVAGAVLWRRTSHPQRLKTPKKLRPVGVPVPLTVTVTTHAAPLADGQADLEAGLLALEAGASVTALEWLRRATFRYPDSPVAQFALARAYDQNGDATRAQTALVRARRLLAPLADDSLVPGSDALLVAVLRQTVHTYLAGLHV